MSIKEVNQQLCRLTDTFFLRLFYIDYIFSRIDHKDFYLTNLPNDNNYYENLHFQCITIKHEPLQVKIEKQDSKYGLFTLFTELSNH